MYADRQYTRCVFLSRSPMFCGNIANGLKQQLLLLERRVSMERGRKGDGKKGRKKGSLAS